MISMANFIIVHCSFWCFTAIPCTLIGCSEWFFIIHHFNRPVHNNYFSILFDIAIKESRKTNQILQNASLVATVPFNFSISIIFHKQHLCDWQVFLFIFLTEYTLCLCLRNRIDVTVLGANDMRKKNHFSQNLQRNKNVFNLYSILKSWFAMHSPWMILQLISLNLMPNCIIWFLKGDELLTDYSNWNLKWNLETIIEQSLDIANGNKRSEVDTCCCFSCKYKWPLDGTNE